VTLWMNLHPGPDPPDSSRFHDYALNADRASGGGACRDGDPCRSGRLWVRPAAYSQRCCRSRAGHRPRRPSHSEHGTLPCLPSLASLQQVGGRATVARRARQGAEPP